MNCKRPFGPGNVKRIKDMVEVDAIILHVVNEERESEGFRVKGTVPSRTGDRIVGFERKRVLVHA
jgi:hypothetical protein